MGCWYKTCGLTRLPILPGREVYTVVLERNTDTTDRCYSTAFWRPVMLPFVSEYNDYGGGEKSEMDILNMILVHLDHQVVPLGQGDNQYHDHPVKREAGFFNEDNFFDLVHEGRLFIGNHPPIESAGYQNKEFEALRKTGKMIDFVMLNKEIVDQYLQEKEYEEYVGDGKGTCGWGNNYVKYKFKDVIDAVPSVIAILKKTREETKFFFADYLFQIAKADSVSIGERKALKAIQWACDHKYSNLVSISELIDFAIQSQNDALFIKMIERVLLAYYIDVLFENVRINWAPGGHEGSQTQDWEEHRKLAQLVAKHCTDNLYEDEEDDE